MAKFCGKCGTKLDETTGLCPNCNAEKIVKRTEKTVELTSKVEENNESTQHQDKLLNNKEAKKKQNGDKKPVKKVRKKVIFGSLMLIVVLLIGVFFAFRAAKEVTNIAENQVEYDNGDIIYIPDRETLCFDEEECTLYYSNLLSVYLLSDLSNEERDALAGSINGEVVGNISGCINYIQIKVDESSLEELNNMANSISQSEHVLYAIYDSPIFMQSLEADNNPWSDNASNPEEYRGEEDNPDGNDWWAEAIGAYTAWEYVDSHADELKPVQVGVIDGGFFTEHEDLEGKVKIFDGWNMVRNEKDELDSHGTAVSGIIAANDNSIGLRGVADTASLVCADWSLFDQNGEIVSRLDTGNYIEITKQMVESECKVINNSWGYVGLKSEDGFKAALKGEALKNIDEALWKKSMLEVLVSFNDSITYEEYKANFVNNTNKYTSISLCLIIELLLNRQDDLLNRQDDFLIIQSAGNGYDDVSIGYEAVNTGFYCGITEKYYENWAGDRKIGLEKLGIDYQEIDSHILIVGAAKNEMDNNNNYHMSEWSCYGNRVNICAPGENLFVCGTVEQGRSKYNKKWQGTSLSAPMVSGAAALLWSIDPDLTAAEVRDLLLQSNHNAVGVGTDAETEYPMLNVGESVKQLTGWSNYTNIQEGLYLEPGTQNVLYVEQDEDEISFTAWWFKLASIEETAKLDGNDAEFVCGEESTGQTSGKIHFEDSKAILTLDGNRLSSTTNGISYLDEQTEYVWLRDSMWELSEKQLKEIGTNLGVPEDLDVQCKQFEPYYESAWGCYLTDVQFLYNGKTVAMALVDSFTGELARNIWMYSDSNIQSSAENIPDDARTFGKHRYYIYEGSSTMDWNVAQEFCESQGGHLATISNADEDKFLYSFMIDSGYSYAMFGLSDQDITDVWTWVTDEEFVYENWESGEPNHQGGYEHFGMYYSEFTEGTWNDGSGAGGSFICEWE